MYNKLKKRNEWNVSTEHIQYAKKNYYITSSFSVVSNYAEIEDKDDWSVNTWVVVS